MSHSATTAPVQTRSARVTSTNPSDLPPASSNEVNWKFTPLDRITDLLEGPLTGTRYPFTVTSSGPVTIEWKDVAVAKRGIAGLPEEVAAARAWSASQEVLHIAISAQDASSLTLTRNELDETPRAAHTIIHVAPFAKSTIVLANEGTARLSENVEFIIGAHAEITVVSLQDWADDAAHLATHYAHIDAHATLKHVLVSFGGDVVRINPSAHLAAEAARGDLLGLYFADSGQHIEHQVYAHHIAPHTVSRVTYKGALQGDGARTVWIGDVLIGREAVGTDSYEQNRNLVLTDNTRADSIPNLEIETGDIAGAGHASATGRFDEEQLFYLESRGITSEEARRLVVRGFLNEVVQSIGIADVEERVTASLDRELAEGSLNVT